MTNDSNLPFIQRNNEYSRKAFRQLVENKYAQLEGSDKQKTQRELNSALNKIAETTFSGQNSRLENEIAELQRQKDVAPTLAEEFKIAQQLFQKLEEQKRLKEKEKAMQQTLESYLDDDTTLKELKGEPLKEAVTKTSGGYLPGNSNNTHLSALISSIDNEGQRRQQAKAQEHTKGSGNAAAQPNKKIQNLVSAVIAFQRNPAPTPAPKQAPTPAPTPAAAAAAPLNYLGHPIETGSRLYYPDE